ncbi:hypothetical protein NXS19_009250 [Fusarium pseudograminearum]|nr:hypothetical protein NXS19_009250 [Fusarium pseudograminearum]
MYFYYYRALLSRLFGLSLLVLSNDDQRWACFIQEHRSPGSAQCLAIDAAEPAAVPECACAPIYTRYKTTEQIIKFRRHSSRASCSVSETVDEAEGLDVTTSSKSLNVIVSTKRANCLA